MNPRKWLLTIVASILLIAVTTVTIIWACGTSPRPNCAQTAWLAKIVTGVVVVPPAATAVDVTITLIPNVSWTVAPAGSLFACAFPTAAEIVLTVTFPGMAPQMFTVAAPVPVTQGPQPPIITTIRVTLPPGGVPVGAVIAGEYRVTFSGGVGGGLVIGLGDTEVCFVDPSPLDPEVPRLDMQLIPEDDLPYQACQRGDRTCSVYFLSNNDPDDSVELTLTGISTQIARLPGGDAPNRYAVSAVEPGTDNFPVSFDGAPLPTGDPMDPDDPVNHPATTTVTLGPLEQTFVKLNTGIHGMCANGSCSELLVKALGTWTLAEGGTEPALACAGTAVYVDNNVPAKTPLCDIIDQVKSAPHLQCAWETAFYGTDPHHSTLPGRDDPGVPLNDFITPGQDPLILSSLTVPALGGLVGGGGQGEPAPPLSDILRLPEAPNSVRYIMDCTDFQNDSQIRNHLQINGFNHLPPDQPFAIPFFHVNNRNPAFFDIDIPQDPAQGVTIIRWYDGPDNLVHEGPFSQFCETPPDGILGCDFNTCRTFTKIFPPSGADVITTNPKAETTLLRGDVADDFVVDSFFDVFSQITLEGLTFSASTLGPQDGAVSVSPESTTDPNEQLKVTLKAASVPTAPDTLLRKVRVENPNAGQTTIFLAARKQPVPPPDEDGDGVPDDTDNAVCVKNPAQRDTDGDGVGNVIDPDLNNDGRVTIADFILFRGAYGTRVGDARFNPDADFNGDGAVGIDDFNTFRALFGQPVDKFGLCQQ